LFLLTIILHHSKAMATIPVTKISVLLPVYNTHPDHLKAAIDSVLAQTFQDFELIICNDASTDPRTEEMALSYADSRIRYLKNETNSGIAKVRNDMIGHATGEYLAVMDHDDLCLPARFEKQIAYMDAHPEVAICGTAHKRFGKMFKNNVIRYPEHHDDIQSELFFKNVIHHPSAMMRKDVLVKHGLRYDETLVSANDRKLFMDVSAVAQLHNLQEVLCLYRLHRGMTSRNKRVKILNEQKTLRQGFIQKIGANLSDAEFEVLNHYIMSGRNKIKDLATLISVESVLSKVIAANRVSGFLPVHSFEKKCAKYFIKRCYNAAVYGLVSSRELLANTSIPVSSVKQPAVLKLVNYLKG
jgi:glycosyltransferase involved in cell wall biosynthesis